MKVLATPCSSSRGPGRRGGMGRNHDDPVTFAGRRRRIRVALHHHPHPGCTDAPKLKAASDTAGHRPGGLDHARG